MEIIRYQIKEASLHPWVNFIWEMNMQDKSVNNKLLPTNSIDLILNMGDPIVYSTGSKRIAAPAAHINGLRSGHSYIYQTGHIHVIGISFAPFGLYPFIQTTMASIKDAIVNLHDINGTLAAELEQAVRDYHLPADCIEKVLLSHLSEDNRIIEKAALLRSFLSGEGPVNIQLFCSQNGIQVKTFERLCLRYTSYTPSVLRKIRRFQTASNQIVHEKPSNLADAAYDNNYADQAHLIRDFKALSGEPPREFTQKKESVKENAKYKYR